jgi:hypothetical protein
VVLFALTGLLHRLVNDGRGLYPLLLLLHHDECRGLDALPVKHTKSPPSSGGPCDFHFLFTVIRISPSGDAMVGASMTSHSPGDMKLSTSTVSVTVVLFLIRAMK